MSLFTISFFLLFCLAGSTLMVRPKKSVATLSLMSIGFAASFCRWLVVFFDPFGVRETSGSLTGVLLILEGALLLPWDRDWMEFAAMTASILLIFSNSIS